MGSMLDNAAYAVAPNTSTQIYRKLDNTGYTFQGRSYGVGASVGLVELPQQDGLLNYTLVESGFMANVTCWYNRITTFHVSPRPGYAWYWQGCGHISSGDHECYSVPGYDDSEVVILAGDPYRGQNEWGIATGQGATGYAALNQTSCEVIFNLQDFSVTLKTRQSSLQSVLYRIAANTLIQAWMP